MESKPHSLIKNVMRIKEMGILLCLIFITVVISVYNPVFLSAENLINVLRSSSFIFIIGIAMTYVLIAGDFDLSVGPTLALGGILSAMAVTAGIPLPISILLGVLIGAAIGVLNGLLVVKFNIPALIVTLGTMYIGRGLVLIITKGAPIYPLPDDFNNIGQGEQFSIPNVVIIAVVLAVIANIILNNTKYGRSVYAVGGNRETARLSGINTDKIKISVYILTGAASALSGVLMAGRLGSAQPSAGTGYELMVIAAVIIGGTSLFGGSGTIAGTAIGALLMSVISNGMVLMKVSAYWQNLIVGVIIILAVGLDQYRRKRSGVV